ncbi:MAG TPA: LysM peptidoglycan-binding domain-containing protein [Thermohalobaculum sp.]|nr:LysM peptidoglycan-binding domain-containing protein [Thermohalobaculum sp.]
MHELAKWLVGIGLAVIVALAVWFQTRPAMESVPGAEVVVAPAVEAITVLGAETVVSVAPQPKPTPAVAPEFDVVRVSAEGQTVLAGRAAPGQTVEVLLDGLVIGTAEADENGSFAAVLDLEPSSEARVLTMRSPMSDVPETVVSLAPAISEGTGVTHAVEAAKAEQAAAEAIATEATKAAAAFTVDAAEKQAAAEVATVEAATAVAAAKAAQAVAAATNTASAATESTTSGTGQGASETTSAEAASAEAAAAAEVAAANASAAIAAAAEAAEAEAAAMTAAKVAAAEVAIAKQATDAAAASAEPNVARYAVSTPVIILPPAGAEQAPLLVKPEAEGVTLLQPAEVEPAARMVLDRLTYSERGDLVAAGRGRPGSAVRIYANAVFLAQIQGSDEGQWQVKIASEVATSALLLRFDEVDATGHVLSRIETPFEYSPLVISHELHERKIVVQKGDHLWKFAEQHYGEGWRYSVIFSANEALIRDPDLIYPGQVFSVPELVNSQ